VSYKAQADRLLEFFKARAGRWVPLPDILALGMASHTRRIHELRKDGWAIEMKSTRVGQARHTEYMLLEIQPEVRP
jgi:hypothetical protein